MPDSNPLANLARKLASINLLSETDIDAIQSLPYEIRELEPQSQAIRSGDFTDKSIVLLEGFAFRYAMSENGDRQIVSLHFPGDTLTISIAGHKRPDHGVQTLTRAKIALFSSGASVEIARQRPALMEAGLSDILVENSILREWALNQGRRDAQARLMHLFCEFAARLDDRGLHDGEDYIFPMTQAQIAEAVGLTVVHVNRALRKLELLGHIRRHRGRIVYSSWTSMRDAIRFDSAYLHLSSARDTRDAT